MGKPQLLIVDDEAPIRSVLSQWFEICGFEVDTAEDGVVALTFCEKRTYNAITMDMEMPRMGGIEAIQAIRQVQATVPILVLTGLPRDADLALAAGASKILMKPFRLKELEEEVRALLG